MNQSKIPTRQFFLTFLEASNEGGSNDDRLSATGLVGDRPKRRWIMFLPFGHGLERSDGRSPYFPRFVTIIFVLVIKIFIFVFIVIFVLVP